MKIRIHYHSDCPFFAGCENMLANFFNSREFREDFEVSFSYRYSPSYAEGFGRRVHRDLPTFPLRMADPQDIRDLFATFPPIVRRISGFVSSFPILVTQIFLLYRFLKRGGADVLHINNGGYPAALSARAAAIAGRMAGVPKIIMVVNNMAVDNKRFLRRFDYPIDRLVVQCVDLFITGSTAARKCLADVLKLPERQAMSIYNGIAMRKATETSEETRRRLGLEGFDGVVFGVVALLIPRKGHKVLLDAVKALIERRGEGMGAMKVLIEGDGPLREELVDFVASHSLQSTVCFVGHEPNIVNFMAALDVLVLPSVQDEDFPNVVLEAMALGKPVIATRIAGIPEQVVDGECGILVEPRDVSGLADALGRMLDEPAPRNAMGIAAVKRFEESFTDSVSLKKYRNMYFQLIKDSDKANA